MRIDERKNDELRTIKFTRNFIKHAEGSVLVEMGGTKVICTATVDDRVPQFRQGTGEGWLTAEYSMLPRATGIRNIRDISKLRIGGRRHEIQRLIGRSLRTVVDFKELGELTIIIDCDVIQADGGTRTASINGGYVALVDCIDYLYGEGIITSYPMKGSIAAISMGIVQEEPMLDLCFEEDSHADVDMNLVMDDKGNFVEIQGTGENISFTRQQFEEMLTLGEKGTKEILEMQKDLFKE